MKHKNFDMIMAKAENMGLAVFIKGANRWDEQICNKDQLNFSSVHSYFLCLPKHAEACLHWLNGGWVKDGAINWKAPTKIVWRKDSPFMDANANLQILNDYNGIGVSIDSIEITAYTTSNFDGLKESLENDTLFEIFSVKNRGDGCMIELQEVKPLMNIDNIETQEEKEVFDKMSNPKTKVEYVKVDATPTEIAKMMIDGEILWSEDGQHSFAWSGYRFEVDNGGTFEIRGDFYRKVETPVEWWEGAAEYVSKNIITSGDGSSYVSQGDHLKINARLSQEQWKEFAKLILEG